MKITKEEILHVAHLARLDIEEAATDKFAVQIGNILEYVDQLRTAETEGIEPTSHALSLTNAFREDEPREHLHTDKVLANAPQREGGSFVVPKVID